MRYKLILINSLLSFFFCGDAKAVDTLYSRGLFVTVIQNPQVLSSRQSITDLVAYAKQANVKMLFIQVYRADQAWFPSKVGDPLPYETCLKSVGEDPFALLLRQAHAEGIKVHGWVNLLSLGKNTQAPLLKKYGASILTRNKKKKKILEDYQIDGQYFLEPGDLRVRAELLSMVGELVRAYPDMDGIQFDYIRYPDKEPYYGYSRMNIDRFKESKKTDIIIDGSKIWQDWKRAQVTALLEALVKRVRMLRPGLTVSTTGCAPSVRALEEAFQDWPSWINSGLLDFVTVMTYSPEQSEFEKFIRDAKSKVKYPGRLNFAIGAYQHEKMPEKFGQQLESCQKESSGACIIFHYGNVLLPSIKEFLVK